MEKAKPMKLWEKLLGCALAAVFLFIGLVLLKTSEFKDDWGNVLTRADNPVGWVLFTTLFVSAGFWLLYTIFLKPESIESGDYLSPDSSYIFAAGSAIIAFSELIRGYGLSIPFWIASIFGLGFLSLGYYFSMKK